MSLNKKKIITKERLKFNFPKKKKRKGKFDRKIKKAHFLLQYKLLFYLLLNSLRF